jgi:hypothetical protein
MSNIQILCIGIALAVLIPTTVYASHLWGGSKFFTTNAEYCISPSYSTSMRDSIRMGLNDINALPTKITWKEEAYGSNCNTRVFPYNFNPNYLAMSSLYRSNPTTITHADILTNTYYKWTGSPTYCVMGTATGTTYNVRYTMHHEFGHVMGLRHPTVAESTVMYPSYHCSYWNSYKSHDVSTLNGIYGTSVGLALPYHDVQSMRKMASLVVLGQVVAQASGGIEKIEDKIIIPQEKSLIKIETVLKGDYEKPTVEVFTPRSAGKIVIDDAYELRKGERAAFMLFEYEGKYNLVGLGQGKYDYDGRELRGKFIKDSMTVEDFQRNLLKVEPPKEEQERSLPPSTIQEDDSVPNDEKVQQHRDELAKQSEMENKDKEEAEWKKQLREHLGIRDPSTYNRTMDDENRERLRIVT